MPDPVKTRAYRSELRAQQAAGTRRAVLAAARELFATRGYADTPVAAVARQAGVSVDTVYAAVGRKPQLLLAVHDLELAGGTDDVPSEQRDYVAEVRAAVGARAKLTTYADALAARYPTTAPLAEALRDAGLTDPACRRVWEELQDRRARMMLRLAADLRATGELREDLTDDDVAHLVWCTNGPEHFRLGTARGRTPEQYAATLADLWTRTLLA